MDTASQAIALVPPALELPPVRNAEPTRKRWTRAEYYRLDEQGWFRDQRVELIDGEIILSAWLSPQRAVAIELVRNALLQSFPNGYWVRQRFALVYDDYSEPEPDIALVHGEPDDYSEEHPKFAPLVVEVGDNSLAYDKNRKLHLYASMGVPEYWILDLNSRRLLVYREPTADASAPFGFSYAMAMTLSESEAVSPLEKPSAKIDVFMMLPSKR
jgi:Uma2 family endonuclease